jgi:hypothetical protein
MRTSPYDLISRAVAKARLATAQGVGVEVIFTHRGQDPDRLYVQPGEAGIEWDQQNGVVTEVRTQIFYCPIQRGFSNRCGDAEPVTIGDTIEWHDKVYAIKGVTMDPYKSIYTLNTVEHKRLTAGAGR